MRDWLEIPSILNNCSMELRIVKDVIERIITMLLLRLLRRFYRRIKPYGDIIPDFQRAE